MCSSHTPDAALMLQSKAISALARIAQGASPSRKHSNVAAADLLLAAESLQRSWDDDGVESYTLDKVTIVAMVNAAGRCGRVSAYTDIAVCRVLDGQAIAPYEGLRVQHQRSDFVAPIGKPPKIMVQPSVGPLELLTDGEFTAGLINLGQDEFASRLVFRRLLYTQDYKLGNPKFMPSNQPQWQQSRAQCGTIAYRLPCGSIHDNM